MVFLHLLLPPRLQRSHLVRSLFFARTRRIPRVAFLSFSSASSLSLSFLSLAASLGKSITPTPSADVREKLALGINTIYDRAGAFSCRLGKLNSDIDLFIKMESKRLVRARAARARARRVHYYE